MIWTMWPYSSVWERDRWFMTCSSLISDTSWRFTLLLLILFGPQQNQQAESNSLHWEEIVDLFGWPCLVCSYPSPRFTAEPGWLDFLPVPRSFDRALYSIVGSSSDQSNVLHYPIEIGLMPFVWFRKGNNTNEEENGKSVFLQSCHASIASMTC